MSEKAQHACLSCRKQKRKCDKSLPNCRLCARVDRKCEYTNVPLPPTAADMNVMQSKIAELEKRLDKGVNSPVSTTQYNGLIASQPSEGVSREFPNAMFLDFECFKWAGMRVPKLATDLPADVVSILSHGTSIVDTASQYFKTVHSWFPIISKKRFELGIAVGSGGPDIAILMLALKLIMSSPDEDMSKESSIYAVTKRYLNLLETLGLLSLQMMQAMTLVALYEYSHAIYPAAWMTVGSCSRYAEFLGLSSGRETYRVLGQSTTWTEAEERKRAWWSVYILDRAISLGSKRRFSLSEPVGLGNLPVNDQVWDAGNVTQAIQQPTSTHFSIPQSSYARICQSALLVSRAAAYNGVKDASDDSRVREISELTNELTEFAKVIRYEYLSGDRDQRAGLLASYGLARSALFMLLDIYCCPDNVSASSGYVPSSEPVKNTEETMLQMQAMQVIQLASEEVCQICVDITTSLSSKHPPRSMSHISPLAFDAIYCTLATFNWIWSEGGGEELSASIAGVRLFFEMVAERWKLGREYLVIADFHTRLWQQQ